MEGGRRAEAESSSAAARAPPEISDDLAEEAKAEFGVGDDEDDGDNEVGRDEGEEPGADGFVPSPLIPLSDQVEKDKEDESLRRWKEKLLGGVDGELNSKVEPEVTFHSIGVVSEGFANLITSLPVAKNQSQILFTLKEGSKYRLRLTFTVRHNIVSGLTYSNVVWKRGIKDYILQIWWIKSRECLVHLLLGGILTNICLKKRLLHLGSLLEEFTQQNLSLKMMIRDVIRSLAIPSKSRSTEDILSS
ncbi:unnamed protein product, partial [Musa acuminata var. zebrina]